MAEDLRYQGKPIKLYYYANMDYCLRSTCVDRWNFWIWRNGERFRRYRQNIVFHILGGARHRFNIQCALDLRALST